MIEKLLWHLKYRRRVEVIPRKTYFDVLTQVQPRWVSPIGRPPFFLKLDLCFGADPNRKLIGFNRYPRQIIGVTLRLPKTQDPVRITQSMYPYLHLRWAQPAKWFADGYVEELERRPR